MKIKKLLASVLATAVAVSAMATTAFASLSTLTLAESGNAGAATYLVAAKEGVDYSKVESFEFYVTLESDYLNGAIGTTIDGDWTQAGYELKAPDDYIIYMEGLNGIDSTGDDGTLKSDVIQIQAWWLNAGTVTVEGYAIFDAEGNVLDSDPVEEPSVAETYKASVGIQFDTATSTVAEWFDLSSQSKDFVLDEETTITIDLGTEKGQIANFFAIITDIPEVLDDADEVIKEIDMVVSSIKLDGVEIPFTADDVAFKTEEGVWRYQIRNTWGGQDGPAGIADVLFSKLEVTFIATAVEVEDPEDSTVDPEDSTVDPEDSTVDPEDSTVDTDTDTDTDADTDTETPDNSNTGDAGIVALAVLSGLALAGIVVSNKRK